MSTTPTPGPSGSVLPGLKGYNPNTLQPWTVAVVASMTILQVVAVALRLYCRYLKAQQLWWDDYVIIWAMVGSLYSRQTMTGTD
jgi:hypothetical protein